ncbi:MAG: S8 family serine peptidase [Bacteroidia bacterium]|nr:S8 family serine peptidase [Bacteroidia bacterium]
MMQHRYTLPFLAFLLLFSASRAQQAWPLYLQSGTVEAGANVTAFINAPVPREVFGGYYYRFLQFGDLPGKEQREEMRRSGLVLMDYVPKNSFMTAIPVSFNRSQLRKFGVVSVIKQEGTQKINRNILGGFQDWAIKEAGTVDLQVQYQANIPLQDVLTAAAVHGRIISHQAGNNSITLRVSAFGLTALADEHWVYYINTVAAPDVKDDTKGRSLHRSNSINSDFVTGRRFDGNGVTVAIADDGFVGPHIDFSGRMTNFATGTGQSHGDMTSGICVGAGNLNPAIRGMATGTYLYTYNISGYPQIVNAVANYNSYGIVITSTSYSQGCNEYNSDTQFGDNLLYNNPQLAFVFSAGNSQSSNCNYGAGAGWGNITGGYKQGKNVVACGNLDELEVLDPTSSRGPSADGRIKPDICANGRNQLSTNENNTYQVGGGTSAASPGVAGIFAQLYQAYKSLTSAPNPPAALIKACLLNSAEDIGNAGPDFTYGWGRVNALRALQTLEQNRYLSDSVTQGNTKTHTIAVPANTRQIRVMVYWADVGGSPAAAPALVNNLNMTLRDPSLTVWNPWILNPAPTVAALTSPAVRGVDSLNNIEQVTLDNPAAGTYTVSINGYALPSIGQRYYLVWEFRSDAVTMTYPNGAEGFVPGEVEVLRWDGQRNLGTYALDYSVDNGSTWLPIAASVAQTVQQYSWTVPNNVSGAVKLRVSRGAFSDVSDSSLAIIGVPGGLAVSWACPDSLRLTWNAVSGAAGYTIYKLGLKYMEVVGTSTTNSFVLTGTNPGLEYWFSVCANTAQGNKGRRALAIKKSAGTFSCPLPLDARLASVASPAPGNVYACQNLAAVPVTVVVENTGQNTLTNIPVNYTLNGGAVTTQVMAGPLNPGATASFTFSGTINLSAGGAFTLRAWTSLPGDFNLYNDTLQTLSNVFATATTPYSQNFEGSTFAPSGWSINNGGGSTTWIRRTNITGAAGGTTASAYMDNYSYNSPGTEDALGTGMVSLAGASSALLTFDVSYARYSATYTDGLRVDISTDCGASWQPTGYQKSDLVLATAGTVTSSFVPTSAAQWRKDTVLLNNWTGSNVMLRFVNINGYGNNLYIDNVQISSLSAAGLSLTVLLEGFHNGSSNMVPALMNAGVPGAGATDCDTIQVSLHQALSPYATVSSSKGILSTSGQGNFSFPGSVIGNSYYIAVNHRNALETWSAAPVLFSANTSYNFKTAASQAYGGNVKQVLPGVFALYSGDLLPQDGITDIIDQAVLNNDILNFATGYLDSDLNGDGFTDILDQLILDNNIFNFVGAVHP